MTDNILALENQLCFAVYSAAHAFNKAYKPLLARLGITYPQYLVMLVLWEKRSAPVTTIGQALGLDTGTLSPLLKRLEKTGLIRRERSRDDERQVLIHLTPAGAAKRAEALDVVHSIGAAVGCARDESIALRTALETLKEKLETA
jgi:DNA-binding MarR family transcriptional regulator